MTMHQVFKYQYLDLYGFEELPKGNMLELSMNPYNGKVYVKTEKHQYSTDIALDIMREIVRACDVYERNGSLHPLRDLIKDCNGSDMHELVHEKVVSEFMEKIGEGEENYGLVEEMFGWVG